LAVVVVGSCPVHKAYVYTLFEKISKQALLELHEIDKIITRKINALSKKHSFKEMLFEKPVHI